MATNAVSINILEMSQQVEVLSTFISSQYSVVRKIDIMMIKNICNTE